jgi:hypothetical protein
LNRAREYRVLGLGRSRVGGSAIDDELSSGDTEHLPASLGRVCWRRSICAHKDPADVPCRLDAASASSGTALRTASTRLDDRCAPNASMIAVWTSPPAATGARSTQNGRPPAARQRSTATAPADYSALAVRLGLD